MNVKRGALEKGNRYLKVTVLLAALISIGIFFGAGYLMEQTDYSIYDAGKILKRHTTVMLEGEDIEIVNAERGYFAVRDEEGPRDEFRIVNLEGETLAKIPGYGMTPWGGYMITWGGDGTWVLDRETMKYTSIDLTSIEMVHESGYLSGLRRAEGEQDAYVILDEAGDLLYKSDEYFQLAGEEGCLVQRDKRNGVIDFRTGQVLYQPKEGEWIVDGKDGLWLAGFDSKDPYYYLLDENFQPVFGGRIFQSVVRKGNLTCGMTWEDGESRQSEARVCVLDRQGNVLYEGAEGESLMGCVEGAGGETIVIVRQDETDVYRYLTPKAQGMEQIAETRGMVCYMDFADGYGVCCKYEDRLLQEVRSIAIHVSDGDPREDSSKEGGFRWTYVDRDMRPVMEFAVKRASFSEDGYAVVQSGDKAVLIDLMKRGDVIG